MPSLYRVIFSAFSEQRARRLLKAKQNPLSKSATAALGWARRGLQTLPLPFVPQGYKQAP